MTLGLIMPPCPGKRYFFLVLFDFYGLQLMSGAEMDFYGVDPPTCVFRSLCADQSSISSVPWPPLEEIRPLSVSQEKPRCRVAAL